MSSKPTVQLLRVAMVFTIAVMLGVWCCAQESTPMITVALSEANIKNHESRLRSLVNAPGFSDQRLAEIVPIEPALTIPMNLDIESEVAVAIDRRPEIRE